MYLLLFVSSNVAEEEKRAKSVDDTKPRSKPRTVWEKPDITNLTDESFILKWKPSSIPA